MAAHGLASWVRAIVAYHNSLQVIRPKQARLEEAEAEHARVAASLREKEAELAKVEERLGALAAKLRASKQRKQQLEDEVRLTNLKLQRARQLVQQLGSEAQRWVEEARSLDKKLRHYVGDVLVSAATIAYMGPFPGEVRSRTIQSWFDQVLQSGVGISVPGVTGGGDGSSSGTRASGVLERVLGDPVQLQQWTIAGLPPDPTSIESALITTNARRWPLLVDP